jgi:ribosomal protein L12E/L44/L45/RPP1/RPP2
MSEVTLQDLIAEAEDKSVDEISKDTEMLSMIDEIRTQFLYLVKNRKTAGYIITLKQAFTWIGYIGEGKGQKTIKNYANTLDNFKKRDLFITGSNKDQVSMYNRAMNKNEDKDYIIEKVGRIEEIMFSASGFKTFCMSQNKGIRAKAVKKYFIQVEEEFYNSLSSEKEVLYEKLKILETKFAPISEYEKKHGFSLDMAIKNLDNIETERQKFEENAFNARVERNAAVSKLAENKRLLDGDGSIDDINREVYQYLRKLIMKKVEVYMVRPSLVYESYRRGRKLQKIKKTSSSDDDDEEISDPETSQNTEIDDEKLAILTTRLKKKPLEEIIELRSKNATEVMATLLRAGITKEAAHTYDRESPGYGMIKQIMDLDIFEICTDATEIMPHEVTEYVELKNTDKFDQAFDRCISDMRSDEDCFITVQKLTKTDLVQKNHKKMVEWQKQLLSETKKSDVKCRKSKAPQMNYRKIGDIQYLNDKNYHEIIRYLDTPVCTVRGYSVYRMPAESALKSTDVVLYANSKRIKDKAQLIQLFKTYSDNLSVRSNIHKAPAKAAPRRRTEADRQRDLAYRRELRDQSRARSKKLIKY